MSRKCRTFPMFHFVAFACLLKANLAEKVMNNIFADANELFAFCFCCLFICGGENWSPKTSCKQGSAIEPEPQLCSIKCSLDQQMPPHCLETVLCWGMNLDPWPIVSLTFSYMTATILGVNCEIQASLVFQDKQLPGFSVGFYPLSHTILATPPQSH